MVNHVEPDHNGGLRLCMEAMPQAKVVASAGGVRGIAEYHGPDLEISPVGADDVIDLGGKTLQLPADAHGALARLDVHVLRRVCTLMPNDAFGQHLATSERFADEIDLDLAIEELTVYYANILMPLSTQVGKAVAKVIELGLDMRHHRAVARRDLAARERARGLRRLRPPHLR